jgi:hypothetical protein
VYRNGALLMTTADDGAERTTVSNNATVKF